MAVRGKVPANIQKVRPRLPRFPRANLAPPAFAGTPACCLSVVSGTGYVELRGGQIPARQGAARFWDALWRFQTGSCIGCATPLGAYHDYGRAEDNKPFNWKDMTEGIDYSVGLDVLKGSAGAARERLVKQFSERLRQFVEGVRRSDGTWHYPEPQELTVKAIHEFLIGEDLLSEEELRNYDPGPQAALRLLEYLDQAFDAERIAPPSTLEGTYRSERFEPDDFVVRNLTLHSASKPVLSASG